MSDIQAGDLVIRVRGKSGLTACPIGAIDRCVDVIDFGHWGLGILLQCHQIPKIRGKKAWDIRSFRKLNDGEDDAELIERIKNCRPAHLPELTPITAAPVRLSEEVWPAEVWAEIERIQNTPDPFEEQRP